MSLTTSEMTPADIAAVTRNNDNCGNGNGFLGGDGLFGLIILFVFASMFGFGGFGGFGGLGGGGGILPWLLFGNGFGGRDGGAYYASPCATQADLAAGFNNSAVLGSLNDLKLGQAGLQQTLCQGFNGVNTTVLQGFNGVDNAICTLGYNMQGSVNALSHQLSDCCCTTQRAIDGLNYNMATQACDTRNTIQSTTRDIIENQNTNARAILDALTAQRLADKDERIAEQNQKIFALELAASQATQNGVIRAAIDASTAEIIRRSGHDCPQPAYLVNGPTPVNFPVNSCGQVQLGNNCGCGC